MGLEPKWSDSIRSSLDKTLCGAQGDGKEKAQGDMLPQGRKCTSKKLTGLAAGWLLLRVQDSFKYSSEFFFVYQSCILVLY